MHTIKINKGKNKGCKLLEICPNLFHSMFLSWLIHLTSTIKAQYWVWIGWPKWSALVPNFHLHSFYSSLFTIYHFMLSGNTWIIEARNVNFVIYFLCNIQNWSHLKHFDFGLLLLNVFHDIMTFSHLMQNLVFWMQSFSGTPFFKQNNL